MVKNVKAEMWDGKGVIKKGRLNWGGGGVRTSWFAIKKSRMSDSKKIEEQAIYRTKETAGVLCGGGGGGGGGDGDGCVCVGLRTRVVI
jgi:hypothetical protein